VSTVVLLAVPATGFGYLLLAALVGGESAGIPLPGETALIAAAVLASQGKLSISLVIATSAAGAIVGDNFGYLLGRKGARRLLERPGRLEERRRSLLRRGEKFFARHGGKTVFLGRWLPFLRITAAWLAGANHMPWPKFLAWNAAGGIAWAISVGVFAYFVGEAAVAVIHTAGYVALGVFTVALVAVAAWAFFRRR
jgi:membrane-associated protein